MATTAAAATVAPVTVAALAEAMCTRMSLFSLSLSCVRRPDAAVFLCGVVHWCLVMFSTTHACVCNFNTNVAQKQTRGSRARRATSQHRDACLLPPPRAALALPHRLRILSQQPATAVTAAFATAFDLVEQS